MAQEFSPKISNRGSQYEKFELRVFAGPQTLGVTGDNSYDTIFGREWLVMIDTENSILVYQEGVEDGVWAQVETSDIPATLPSASKNIGCATQQDARLSICFELEDAIYISQYDALTDVYLTRGPFDGHDPVMYNDASLNGEIPNSDVTVFYLSLDRYTIHYRLQRDNFLVEYDLFTHTEPMTLDMVTAKNFQYALWVSDVNGVKLSLPLVSDLAAIIPKDSMAAAIGALTDGDYFLTVLVEEAQAESMLASIGSFTDGVHYLAVLSKDVSKAMSAAVGSLTDGTYFLVVISEDEDEAMGASIGSLADGIYFLVVIVRTPAMVAISSSIGPFTDGSYVSEP